MRGSMACTRQRDATGFALLAIYYQRHRCKLRKTISDAFSANEAAKPNVGAYYVLTSAKAAPLKIV